MANDLNMTQDDLAYLMDLVDQERQGHLNRLADYVLWANRARRNGDPDAETRHQASADSSAQAAHAASELRTKLARLQRERVI